MTDHNFGMPVWTRANEAAMKKTLISSAMALGFLVFATTVSAIPVFTPGNLRSGEGAGDISAPSRAIKGRELPRNPEALAAWQSGQTALASGDLDVAEVAFSKAAQIEPLAYATQLGLADLALRRSRLLEASRFMERALHLAPKSAEVAAAAGRLAVASGRNAEAERQLNRAIELDPQFVTPYLDLGELKMNAGRPRDAASFFRGAVKLDPKHPGASFGLGRALLAQGDVKGALAALDQATRVAPNNPMPLVAIAQVHASQRSFGPALAAIDKALALEPTFERARLARVDILAASGRLPQAVQELESLIALNPGPAGGVFLVKQGNLYQAAGQADAAFSAYQRSVDIDPKLHAGWNNLAWMSAERGRQLEQATVWAKRALELAPGAPNYLDTLGFVYLVRGETKLAVETLTQAVKSAPSAPELHYRLGMALEKHGQVKQALASYQRALSLGRSFEGAAEARRRVTALGG